MSSSEAGDPVRALRWCLSEIRRALRDDGSVDGDPVVLQLSASAVADVAVVIKGTWADAVSLPGLGADLLEGDGRTGCGGLRNVAAFSAAAPGRRVRGDPA
jgi:hypothetical protein